MGEESSLGGRRGKIITGRLGRESRERKGGCSAGRELQGKVQDVSGKAFSADDREKGGGLSVLEERLLREGEERRNRPI